MLGIQQSKVPTAEKDFFVFTKEAKAALFTLKCKRRLPRLQRRRRDLALLLTYHQ